MAEGDQDHGLVPVPVTVFTGGLDQALDLVGGQILAGSDLAVRLATAGLVANCIVFSGRGDQGEVRVSAHFPGLPAINCIEYGPFRYSVQALVRLIPWG